MYRAVNQSEGLGDKVVLLQGMLHARSANSGVWRRSAQQALGAESQVGARGAKPPRKFLKNKGVLEALRAILSIKISTKLMSNFHEKYNRYTIYEIIVVS